MGFDFQKWNNSAKVVEKLDQEQECTFHPYKQYTASSSILGKRLSNTPFIEDDENSLESFNLSEFDIDFENIE